MHALVYAYIGDLQVSPICIHAVMVCNLQPFGKAVISIELSLYSDASFEPIIEPSLCLCIPSTIEEHLLSL